MNHQHFVPFYAFDPTPSYTQQFCVIVLTLLTSIIQINMPVLAKFNSFNRV